MHARMQACTRHSQPSTPMHTARMKTHTTMHTHQCTEKEGFIETQKGHQLLVLRVCARRIDPLGPAKVATLIWLRLFLRRFSEQVFAIASPRVFQICCALIFSHHFFSVWNRMLQYPVCNGTSHIPHAVLHVGRFFVAFARWYALHTTHSNLADGVPGSARSLAS